MNLEKNRSSGNAGRIELLIPSDLRFLDLVYNVFQTLGSECSFDKGQIDEVAQSGLEAVTNAIEHGNGMTPEKTVRIAVETGEGEICFQVSDQGKGFDYQSLEDPLDPANMLRTRGRGIFIMKAFMDSVDFDFSEDRGLTVTLQKACKRSDRRAQA
jgi:serine/threonine-protein kinase RsbW